MQGYAYLQQRQYQLSLVLRTMNNVGYNKAAPGG